MYQVLEFLSAITLGIIEGITEFMPISSTAHLVVGEKFLPITTVPMEVFDVVIQLGSLLAFVFIRKKFILENLLGLFQKKPESINFAIYIILAMLPVVIVGLLISDYVSELKNIRVMAISLIIGGFVLIAVDKYKPSKTNDNIYQIGYLNALVIGIAQIIAFIPGISRSGSTIVAGMLCKQSRNTAVEFSFMLGLCTMIAASSYSLYQCINSFNSQTMPIILVAMTSSFLTSLFTAKFLINFIKINGLYIFGIYRVFVGIVFILLF